MTYQHTEMTPAGGSPCYLDDTLGLITQSIEVEPAQPKTEYLDLPGADGSVDLTEALGLGVLYNDRVIKWTTALRPGADWSETMSAVSDAVNGLRMERICVDGSGFYYTGRVTVTSHRTDRLLKQITLEARCAPFRQLDHDAEVTATTTGAQVSVNVGPRPGTVTVENGGSSALTVSVDGGSASSISAGLERDFDLEAGAHTITLTVASGTAPATVTWKERHL